MKKITVTTLILIIPFIASAFRYVKHESFTDPDFHDYKAKTIAIVVNSRSNEMQIEIKKYLTKYFSKTKVKLVSLQALFPPTRKWSSEEMYKKLLNANVDSILSVKEGFRDKNTTQYGSTTNSNTNIQGSTYGNNFNANANTRTTTTNITHSKSTADFNVTLSDMKTGKTAWLSNIHISAGGDWFTTNKGDAKGVSKRIIKVLLEDGMIDKK